MKANHAIGLTAMVVSGLVLSLAAAIPCPAQTDPYVTSMVQSVSRSRLANDVQALQDFQTRHTYSAGNTSAGDWLVATFAALGLEVERHTFTFAGHVEDNIVARIRGRTAPGEIVVISGHFDSTSEQPTVLAPGADDDASAIAAVIEAATIARSYAFDRTIEFICFNAEEQGRRGSIALATDYQAQGRNLVAVLTSDMIGYWPTSWARDLDVAYEPVSEWLADFVISAGQRHVGIPMEKHLSGMCADDQISFTERGIPAVSTMDCWEAHNGGSETTPYYHRSTDTISTLNLDCFRQAVQVSIAALGELARPIARTGVPVAGAGLPEPAAHILGAYPSPFVEKISIAFTAPANGIANQIEIIDTEGRRLRLLAMPAPAAGGQTVSWDGRDGAGEAMPSGIYFCRLESGAGTAITKIVRVR